MSSRRKTSFDPQAREAGTRVHAEEVTGNSSREPEVAGGASDRIDARVPIARDAIEEVQRRLERERRLREVDKGATVAMLAANLAHQLGTPLSVIRGRAEHLLRQAQNSPSTAAALDTIINQVDKIAGTVRVLLGLSGRRQLTRTLCDVREIVCSSVDLVQTCGPGTRPVIDLQLGDAPLLMRCDPDQLQQSFMNLIGTALDTMTEHGPLSIHAEADFGAEPRIRVVFEYRGCGVAQDLMPRLFDPFSTDRGPRGMSGMGLAVAQSIAREHDGEIAFESIENRARFVMNLPLAADQGAK